MSDTSPTPHHAPAQAATGSPRLVIASIGVLLLLAAMDQTIVATALPTTDCVNRTSARYTIALPTVAQRTFNLTAAPKGAQAGDTGCGTLSLNQAGTRGTSGGDGVANCWR